MAPRRSSAAGVPHARELGLHERATGWIAASETYLAGEWVGRAYMWLLDYEPVARIGPSMRLWYIPPGQRYQGLDAALSPMYHVRPRRRLVELRHVDVRAGRIDGDRADVVHDRRDSAPRTPA